MITNTALLWVVIFFTLIDSFKICELLATKTMVYSQSINNPIERYVMVKTVEVDRWTKKIVIV